MKKIILIYQKYLKRIKHKYFFKYYLIILKLNAKEEINKENKINKLFNDYQKKQEIINKLRQQYLYKEGEKYTFYPIINNYIIKFKYKNPYIINNEISSFNTNTEINNKIAMTEPNNFFIKKKNIKENISNKQTRYNKNKIIKRIKLVNNDNNNINYSMKINKRSTPNFTIKNKTEENISFLNKEKNMTLKSLIQEEKIKDKIINKKLSHNLSKQNVNKVINKIFDKKILKRNKTDASFITNDESNFFTDKTSNITNTKILMDNNITYDNFDSTLKKINLKNHPQKNFTNNFLLNNKSNLINNNNKYNKTTENINNKSPKSIKTIFPFDKIKIKNIQQMNNNRYNNNKINFNKTQINNDETTLTSDYNELKANKEIIYKNISFEIRKKNLNKSNKKNDDDLSIQSLSDSKVLEIANTYIDEQIDKSQINGILTHKKMQNQNYSYEK